MLDPRFMTQDWTYQTAASPHPLVYNSPVYRPTSVILEQVCERSHLLEDQSFLLPLTRSLGACWSQYQALSPVSLPDHRRQRGRLALQDVSPVNLTGRHGAQPRRWPEGEAHIKPVYYVILSLYRFSGLSPTLVLFCGCAAGGAVPEMADIRLPRDTGRWWTSTMEARNNSSGRERREEREREDPRSRSIT